MLLKNYFNKFVLLISLLMGFQVSIASVVEGWCGGKKIDIEIINGADMYESQFKVYYQVKNSGRKFIYTSDIGVFFHVACIKGKNKHDFILFQENCFGNGCPESNYGVFDLNEYKMRIKPDGQLNGNSKQVESLIGYAPPFLSDYKETFCCNREQKKAR